MRHVAVGVDGSGVAGNALMWAADVAIKLDAELVATNCFERPYAEVNPDDHERLMAERQHTLSEDWTAPASHIGVKVNSVVTEGDPRDVLLPTAEVRAADLLVLGRTGAGGGPGFLHLGSAVGTPPITHQSPSP